MITYSILTTTYNRCDTFLPQCIESVQAQVGEGFGFEHIIINDCSTDGTLDYLKNATAGLKNVITLGTPQNSGNATALNAGLERATGHYVLPLDDDDLLLPRSLELHSTFLEKTLEQPVDLAFGYAVLIDGAGKQILNPEIDFNNIDYSDDPEIFYKDMLRNNQLVNSAAIIKRMAALTVGGWSTEVTCQDWEMGLNLLSHNMTYALNPAYLSCYRIHPGQASAVHSKDGTWERDGELLRARYGAYDPSKVSFEQ